MNRQIKFKLWNSKLERFVQPKSDEDMGINLEGSCILGYNDRYACTIRGYSYPIHDEITIIQYTGVKDRNGKEIYEGDIVKTNKDSEAFLLGVFTKKGEPAIYTKGVIKMICQEWCLCQSGIGRTGMKKYVTCDCHDCAALEVIGNIFENPELL